MKEWERYYDKLMKQERKHFLTWGEVAEAMFNYGREYEISLSGHGNNDQEQGKPIHS